MTSQASWQNPRLWLVLGVVFLAGGFGGAVVSRLSMPIAPAKAPGVYWKDGGKEVSLAKLRKELELTPGQADELEGVLDDFIMYYQMLQTQMDDVRSNGKARIMQVLKPEQQKRFEQMMTDLQGKQIR